MSDDDEIARLLREVDAATGAGSTAPRSEQKTPEAAGGSAIEPRAKAQPPEKARSGMGTLEGVLAAAAGGAIVTFLFFLVIPLVGSLGLLSRTLGGAIGGAVGYAVARFFLRRRD